MKQTARMWRTKLRLVHSVVLRVKNKTFSYAHQFLYPSHFHHQREQRCLTWTDSTFEIWKTYIHYIVMELLLWSLLSYTQNLKQENKKVKDTRKRTTVTGCWADYQTYNGMMGKLTYYLLMNWLNCVNCLLLFIEDVVTSSLCPLHYCMRNMDWKHAVTMG